MVNLNIYKISTFTESTKDVANAIKGTWCSYAEKNWSLAVQQNMGHIISEIVPDATSFDITLPSCYDFYLDIHAENPAEDRRVKISGGKLSIQLSAGETFEGHFRLKAGQN